MEEKKVVYYLLWERVVAKREKRKESYNDYLFKNARWVKDEENIIMNHLVGFDASEPEDSPYRYGSTSVLMEMDEISEKDAIFIMNRQILSFLKETWKSRFLKEKEEWDKTPGWPAKFVNTTFKLNGIQYTISTADLGLSLETRDQGFMESIQNDIEKDLEKYGASDIYSSGFLD